MEEILRQFLLSDKDFKIQKFGAGHINHTFLVFSEIRDEKYVLQKINTYVFKNPEIIAGNIDKAAEFLTKYHPEYFFIYSIKTIDNKPFVIIDGEYWRLSPFVKNSVSINIAEDPGQAFTAASAFGLLTRNLHGLPIDGLRESIPGFHDLNFRYKQFEGSLKNGNKERINTQTELIAFYKDQNYWVEVYNQIINNPNFPKRLMHHDTKINNVLLDKTTGKALAVCDLDTLMPGIVVSDLGDMIRTYTSAESEESQDFENVKVRLEYVKALFDGFLSQTRTLLSESEKENLFFAGPYLIYMQGLRFLTDYFNNDVYYPIKYPGHNLNRAVNQKVLLEDYLNKDTEIKQIISNALL